MPYPDPPEYCSPPQAILWISEKREPIDNEEFTTISPPKIPTDDEPYNRLVMALRRKEVCHKGKLVVMLEDPEDDE